MLFIIILRVILSVSASAIQKRLLLDGARVNQTWVLTYSLMLGPAVIATAFRPSELGAAFWRDILIGGGLDAIGNLAMVAALRGTDLSIFGPLNALRPILALGAGWFFLGESPSSAGLGGIGIVFLGALVLFGGKRETAQPMSRPELWKMLALRTAGLSLGTVGAVFLKRAALVSSPEQTVAAWIFCGLIVLVAYAVLRHPDNLSSLGASLGRHGRWLSIHAAVFVTMQWLTIVIFQATLLAYAFVFFQLALVLQVVAGRVFFDEPAFQRRMIGAIIMSLGSGLVAWRG